MRPLQGYREAPVATESGYRCARGRFRGGASNLPARQACKSHVSRSGDSSMGQMRRRGERMKCPACGWAIDEEAYRCPKCRVYFCYKCRARVGKREEQYQCADQSCSCYGKLLCSACTVMVSEERPITRPTFDI